MRSQPAAGASTAAEGVAVSFGFTSGADPSAADLAAGLTYAFDLDGDGVFTAPSSSPAASYAFPDDGAYVAAGRVIDRDGGYTEYTPATAGPGSVRCGCTVGVGS